MKLASSLAFMVFCAACASREDSQAGSKIIGSLNGTTFDVADAVFASGVGNSYASIEVILSSTSNACSDLSGGVKHKGGTLFYINIRSSITESVHPGAYPVAATGQPMYSLVTWRTFTAEDCTPTSLNAVSGSVTVVDIDPTSVSGSFDLVFANGSSDKITGTFLSSACDGKSSDAGPTCQ
jgi:hypothetical protein